METPPSSEKDFVDVFHHISNEIDAIKAGEQRDSQSEKQRVHELTCFVENHADEINEDGTILHQFLRDVRRADNCPTEVLNTILGKLPEAILMNFGGAVPLLEFIRRRSQKMVRAVIEFMAQDIKKRNLASLATLTFGFAETWFEENEQNPDTIEAGREIIQAAFNFNEKPNELLPVDIDLLEMLVNLAAPEMLFKSNNELSPLEQVLRFDLCLSDSDRQLALVMLILDKCPNSIHDLVTKEVRLQPWKASSSLRQPEYSVYRWHIATRESWHNQHLRQIDASTPTQVGPSDRLATSEIASERGLERTQPQPGMMLKGLMTASSARIPSSGLNFDADRPAKPSMLKPNQPPTIMDQPSVLEGRGKEGQVSRRPLLRNGGLSKRRKPKEIRFTIQDIEAADKASDEICKELGVRFLRSTVFHNDETRNAFREIDTEIQRFFGNNEQHYYFAMDTAKEYRDMTETQVRNYFGKRDHYHTLRHVFLQPATILLENDQKTPHGSSRYTDHLQFFNWFREWGVRKIFKVVVYDGDHSHRDEEVEKALAGFVRGKKKYPSFDVEVLDWHKEDLCPEVIQTATPQVRELHLHWSGRNSVLRGWSEPEGLPALEYLQKVYVYYSVPSIEESRIRKNIESFTRRMKQPRRRPAKMGQTNQNSTSTKAPVQMQSSRQLTLVQAHEHFDDYKSLPTIQIVDVGRVTPTGAAGPDRAAGSASESVEQPWFKYVEEFVSIIPTPEELPDYDFKNPHLRRVRLALIDDGVDLFSKSMRCLESRFLEGRSFDQTPDGPNPVYSSVSGHGTFMAKTILRICPFADIIPYRLKTVRDASSNRRVPDAGSAAKAIKAAIEQNVDIISMSWTIRNDNNKIPEATLMELRNVVSACEGTGSRRRRIPIMFCAASDDGIQGRSQHGNRGEFPREINNAKVFCIGAADPHGQVWPEVTDQNGLNYLFPGVDIKDVFEDDSHDSDTISEALGSQISVLVTRNGRTGSSVATALAAGLAALLIHCTKLGHYYTNAWKGPDTRRKETITQQFVDQIATYEGMQNALDNLSSGSRSGTKYANPSKDFACAIQDLRQYDVQGGAANNLPQSLKPIATLCRNLCRI
ncbi:Intracellular serine protease [Colletotrichum scovillei]|uniref:Intracellular serine protease n=2 Tax=Colletotrichum scovillei TaxID=1209932 RepID=A0A9P7U9M7_9PEZI|nr:Intracellular serine protease [Colletotrichum scovillei]KAG7043209.1 Intracellular serine protease [Colletotrichum scovillei]KAG7062656.1 Intracellular serine protease [Colletotrichum scovillei]